MKVIDGMEQGSDIWLKYRLQHITGTDSSTIMGFNIYESKNILWELKMSIRLPKEANAAMKRGSVIEPEARRVFEFNTNAKWPPIVCKSSKYDFAMASLDGFNEELKQILEIKAPGKKNFEKYKEMSLLGEIERSHFCQMQHSFLCTDSQSGYYFCYQTYDNFVVEIKRDDEFIENMLIEEKKFYDCMMNFERPNG